MPERIIFNDASLPFSPNDDPGTHLQEFFTILKKTNDAQVPLDRAVGAEGRWSALVYSENFSFGEWLNNGLDRDERRRIKNVMTKVACPLNPEAEEIIRERIFVLKEDDTITTDALGFASTIAAPSLSFPSHDRWRKEILEVLEMNGDGQEELTCHHEIRNISTVCHVEPFLREIRINRQADTEFFKSLETQENEAFPNILFNKEVLKTLKKPFEVSQYQAQIIYALGRLNEGIVISSSLEELSQNTGLDISGESGKTMENTKLARKRRFSHPSLETASYVAHVKNFPDFKRMHIFPDYDGKKVCVGYFGNHLPTISDPT